MFRKKVLINTLICFLLTSNIFIVYAQNNITFVNEFYEGDNGDVESARNFMMEMYNQKIQDHILISPDFYQCISGVQNNL